MKWESAGNAYGMEKYLWFRGTATQPELQHEVFLERDRDGMVTTYLDCHPAERGPVPQCQHKFVNGELIYSGTYNKAVFLSQWKAQRERMIDLMRSFEMVKTFSGEE